MSSCHWRRIAGCICTMLCVVIQNSAHANKVYLDLDGAEGIIEVDIATGDRRLIEAYDYPDVIGVRLPIVETSDSVFFLGVTATQRRGIHRLNVVNSARTEFSGYTNDSSFDPVGSGPAIDTDLLAGILPGYGELIVLRAARGPMAIDLATGNRRVVSQSADPPVGNGFPLLQPIDLIAEPGGSFLVLENFQGFVRIDLATGNRALAVANTQLLEAPARMERLADGRIAHCQLIAGTDTIFAFNEATQMDEVVTSSGGYQRGAGEAFGTIFDIAIDALGRIFAYDLELQALFMIDPASGDRTIISGGPGNIGSGPELPDAFSPPRLGVLGPTTNAAGASWTRYGADLN